MAGARANFKKLLSFDTISRLLEHLFIKILIFKCFVSKVDFGAGASRSEAFTGGAGANFFYLEPEPKK